MNDVGVLDAVCLTLELVATAMIAMHRLKVNISEAVRYRDEDVFDSLLDSAVVLLIDHGLPHQFVLI